MKLAICFKDEAAKKYCLNYYIRNHFETSENELGISPNMLWIYNITSVVDIKTQININKGAESINLYTKYIEYYEVHND